MLNLSPGLDDLDAHHVRHRRVRAVALRVRSAPEDHRRAPGAHRRRASTPPRRRAPRRPACSTNTETLASVRAEAEEILERSRKTGDATQGRDHRRGAAPGAAHASTRPRSRSSATCASRCENSRARSPSLTLLATEKVVGKSLDDGRPAAPHRRGAAAANLDDLELGRAGERRPHRSRLRAALFDAASAADVVEPDRRRPAASSSRALASRRRCATWSSTRRSRRRPRRACSPSSRAAASRCAANVLQLLLEQGSHRARPRGAEQYDAPRRRRPPGVIEVEVTSAVPSSATEIEKKIAARVAERDRAASRADQQRRPRHPGRARAARRRRHRRRQRAGTHPASCDDGLATAEVRGDDK